MKKAVDSAHDADSNAACGASASPAIASTSSQQDATEHSRPSSLHTDTTNTETGGDTSIHISIGSHGTVEKVGEQRNGRRHSSPAEKNEDDQEDNESYCSYTSYYDSCDEADEEASESFSSSKCSGDRARSQSPGSPPPQEDLLRFFSFTLEDAALKDHRFMIIEAFGQVLLLGTNQGAVAVVDAATGKLKDLLFNHREPISDVDCSANGLYVASSDKAGYVSVQSLRDTRDLWISQLDVPIESIALHPLYHKMDSCPMVCGGGSKVLLLTKGMLWRNSRRVTILQEVRGRIYRVRWCLCAALNIVAWLSDQEITLYDMKNESMVRRVPLPGDMLQNALYPPTLRWERAPLEANSDETKNNSGRSSAVLLCGWGDAVQEVYVSIGSSATASATTGNGGAAAESSGLLQVFPICTSFTAPFQRRASTSPAVATAVSQSAPPRSSVVPTPPSAAGAASSDMASAAAAASTNGCGPYLVELRTPQPLRPSRTAFPYRVCGIAPYGPQRYVILASLIDPHAEGVMKDLEVRVVERATLVDVYRGRMPVRFIHPLQLRLSYTDLVQPRSPSVTAGGDDAAGINKLSASVFEPLSPLTQTQYFILSVDTIVKAMPADTDDHIDFLLHFSQFERAYSYAALHVCQLRRHVLEQVGHQWLLYLFERHATDPTAIPRIIELLPKLVPEYNNLAWEQWIYRLDTCGESWRLVALLPGCSATSKVCDFDSPSDGAGTVAAASPASHVPPNTAATALQVPIKREYYDLVLLRCLRHDVNLFYAALHKFDTLFTVSVVLKAAEAAYREHCSAYAWWSTTDDDEDNDNKFVEGKGDKANNSTGVDAASKVFSPPTSPSAKLVESVGASRDDSGTKAGTMNRTACWSLAASYGYLLRCAGRFEEAIQTLMHLPSSPRSDRELFGLIRSKQLFCKALQLLPELLQRRADATLELLMEHVAPPPRRGGSPQVFLSGDCVAAVSPPASPNTAAAKTPTQQQQQQQPLEVTQYGSVEDPLNVEAVVDRLEKCDRLHLLRYLDLVKKAHPRRFVDIARRHAQLVATLYIDYDRGSLLPFLKEMSMYVERIRELHALCRKNNFVEEEIFLLFRMGREEDALRILIEKMHDVRRALEYVVSIPDREEQSVLFAHLVDFTVRYNASLPCRRKRQDDDENDDADDDGYDAAVASGGIRYVLHQTQPGETYTSIAQRYHVAVDDIRKANRMSTPGSRPGSSSPYSPPSSVSKRSPRGTCALTDEDISGFTGDLTTSEAPPPSRCIVPLNLFGSLLNALADPQFSEYPSVDVRLVLKRLPSDEPIPHAGASVAAIAHTMADETAFLTTVTEIGERDLMGYYAQLLKRRTAAIVMGRGSVGFIASDAKKTLTTAAGTVAGVATAMAVSQPAISSILNRPSVEMSHCCAACHQLVTQQMVVFGCQHAYHLSCVLQYMGEPSTDGAGVNGEATRSVGACDSSAIASGQTRTSDKAENALRKLSVYCRVCCEKTGDHC